ncbi:uncharacterized protein LOC143870070 [Tasmannia lanceolata]|uniref:uncharacterized protein LOC143870070 n=1 Tax=Tasmannia lanceolata TaxID=3420 RepID=UPI004064467B
MRPKSTLPFLPDGEICHLRTVFSPPTNQTSFSSPGCSSNEPDAILLPRFRETQLMASSRNSSSSRRGIRIATRNCKCEKKASIQITQTDENGNRGRLFYACAFFCEGSIKKCNYFRWCKEDMDDNEVGSNRDDIAELKNDMGTLVNLLYELKVQSGKRFDGLKVHANELKVHGGKRFQVFENQLQWIKVAVVGLFILILFVSLLLNDLRQCCLVGGVGLFILFLFVSIRY